MSELTITLHRIDTPYYLKATDPQGHEVLFDTVEKVGGTNRAMRPLMVMLSSLGACSMMDLIGIMMKMRLNFKDVKTTVRAETEPNSKPTRLTLIRLHFDICGHDLPEDMVKRAVQLAVEKYCAVGQIVRQAVPIRYTYTLHESEKCQNIK